MQEIIGGDESTDGQMNVNYKPVLEQARALDKKLTALQNPLYNTEIQPYGQDDVHYLQRFHDQLQALMRNVIVSYGEAPSEVLVETAAGLHKELDQHLAEFNNFINTEVAAFNKTATEHGSSTLFAGGPIQIKAEGSPTPAGSGGYGDNEQP